MSEHSRMEKYEAPITPGDLRLSFNIFRKMSKKHKAIAVQFALYEIQRLKYKKFSNIYYGIKRIAENANCHVETVKDFIEKYEKHLPGLVISHTRRGFKITNIYVINANFFRIVFCLHSLSLLHCWDKVKDDLTIEMEKDEHYLSKRLLKSVNEKKAKLPTNLVEKLPTILRLNTNTKELRIRTEENVRAHPSVDRTPKKKKGILEGLPLPEYEQKYFEKRFSSLVLCEARRGYEWYTRKLEKKAKVPAKVFKKICNKVEFDFVTTKNRLFVDYGKKEKEIQKSLSIPSRNVQAQSPDLRSNPDGVYADRVRVGLELQGGGTLQRTHRSYGDHTNYQVSPAFSRDNPTERFTESNRTDPTASNIRFTGAISKFHEDFGKTKKSL